MELCLAYDLNLERKVNLLTSGFVREHLGVSSQVFSVRKLNQIDKNKGGSITCLTICQSNSYLVERS